MNAAMRAFVWMVYAPQRLLSELRERYRRPPESGTVIIAEEGAERWEAVAPNLNARDASADGKSIRWMVAAGGPGTTLGDLGEGESEGLRGGKDTSELRRRFLLRRQRYLCHMLAVITTTAYNRWVEVGGRRWRKCGLADVMIHAPDISAEDNATLASAASTLVTGLQGLEGLLGGGEALRKLSLRMFIKYSGEQVSEPEFDKILEEGWQTKQGAQRAQEEVESDPTTADPSAEDLPAGSTQRNGSYPALVAHRR
jgi:hypothetical protein